MPTKGRYAVYDIDMDEGHDLREILEFESQAIREAYVDDLSSKVGWRRKSILVINLDTGEII